MCVEQAKVRQKFASLNPSLSGCPGPLTVLHRLKWIPVSVLRLIMHKSQYHILFNVQIGWHVTPVKPEQF